MKRLICILLCIALMIPTLSLSVNAITTATTLSVSSISGNRGDIVNAKVNISSGSGLQACDFELYYDSDVLEVVSAKKGENLTSSPIINTSVLGKIFFSYAATSATTSAGAMLNVEFKIKSDAPYGISTLSIVCEDMSDGKFNAIEHTVKDGTATVIAPKLEAPYSMDVISVTDTAAEIFWSSVEDATGYNIYLNGIRFNAEPIVDNTCELYGLNPDTDYSVQISTVNYTVESDLSDSFSLHTAVEEKQVCFLYLVEDENGELGYSYAYVTLVNGAVEVAPEVPEITGCRFIGWDKELINLEDGDTIVALYEDITPTVTFVDWDGTVLSTQTVEYGKSATAPDYPSRDGYVFTTWDKNFDAVTEDITVTAQYAEITCEHTNTELQGAVESTCVTAGNGGSLVCKDCGTVLSVGTELELAAHKYNSVITEPTPSAQGFTTHTCSVCGDSYVDSYTEYVDENAPKIIVSSARGTFGRQVNITVSLANNPGIVSATLRVVYDSSVMTLSAVEDAALLSGSMHSDQYASPYVLTWANDTVKENITVNGTLVTLTFDIAEDAEVGSYPVKVVYDYDNYDIMNYDSDKVKFYTVDGVVDVSDVIIGDVNGDGNVNNLDRLVLARYLANWSDYPAEMIDMTAADVNCDGLVNNRDRLILARYLAHWADYPEIPLI